MQTGFIYIWYDTIKKLFYVGSHKGHINDGYVCSNKRLKCVYKSRPHTLRRKILENVVFLDHKELLERENYWLAFIKDSELGCVKYYNEKKFATGGDIISSLSTHKRDEHKRKSIEVRKIGYEKWFKTLTVEEKKQRAIHARSFVINPNGGSMPGNLNPFFGKNHSTETKARLSEKRIGNKNRAKTYELIFQSGSIEIFEGIKAIKDKYCKVYPIKFERYVNTGKAINTNRSKGKNSPLIGCKIQSL